MINPNRIGNAIYNSCEVRSFLNTVLLGDVLVASAKELAMVHWCLVLDEGGDEDCLPAPKNKVAAARTPAMIECKL
jgi:hypothetical protein